MLLSGGLDSATCLGIALSHGRECTALSFDYGQRHRAELEAAAHVASHFGVQHRVVSFSNFGGSSLTDSTLSVPITPTKGIPSTYVPGRNLIFLAFAAALAETEKASELYIGVNALDYSGYPDCRPEFVAAAQRAIAPTIYAPLLYLTKAEIIREGLALGVPYHLTTSCYNGTRCGACDSCRIRAAGFSTAGVPDPANV